MFRRGSERAIFSAFRFITSPSQPHSSSPRLLDHYELICVLGVLNVVTGRETAIYGSQTAFYGNIALILMILRRSYLSYLQWRGNNTVLYWRIGCGGYIFLSVNWGCILLPASMPSLCTKLDSHRNNLYRSQSKEVKNHLDASIISLVAWYSELRKAVPAPAKSSPLPSSRSLPRGLATVN